jgi:Ca2+-binding RTX toxin-like protein
MELQGTDRADVLIGGVGNDVLYGYGGADTLQGGSGDDVLRLYDRRREWKRLGFL